jgi:hypothetical protein
MAPWVAVIVALPEASAVASPPDETVATLVADDDQELVVVMSQVLVSEYVAIAVNC